MKLVNIVGARPQFIKAAVISRAINAHNEYNGDSSLRIEEIIVHTGQHYDKNMNHVFFEELEIPEPQYNLGVGSGPHGKMTGAMLEKIETVLVNEKPDCVMVYGDTNTTLAGALAAAKLHMPLAHVEAGLRSFNKKMPEEINRVLTDHISNLLFCPTQTAIDNLTKESIVEGVFWVGDVMYDSFLFNRNLAGKKSKILRDLKLTKGSYALATVHRAENADNIERLKGIFMAFNKIAADHCPLILPVHPRTRPNIEQLNLAPGLNKRLRLIPPLSYLEMINLMSNAKVILTDAGGVQKEAYFAGVPCVTLRKETEWPETLAGGWNRLADTHTKSICDVFNCALASGQRQEEFYFGKGNSGEKTVKIIQSEIV